MVNTGDRFDLPLMYTTGGFGQSEEGVVIRHPGLYRVDVQTNASFVGTYTVQVCLNGVPVMEGALASTCGKLLEGFMMVQVKDRSSVLALRNVGEPMTTLPGASVPAAAMVVTGYEWVKVPLCDCEPEAEA